MTAPGRFRLLDGQTLAAFLEIKPATLRQWASRGKITPRGTSREGWTLYDPVEVTRVAAATRERARPR